MSNSKFGWSLPPGCSSSDIPGNRREDIEDEQIRDNIDDALKPLPALDAYYRSEQIEQAIENLFKLINNAHESGYAHAMSDVDEARSYAALEHADDKRLDDTIERCPDCETPNQFGELCNACREARHEARGEEHAP